MSTPWACISSNPRVTVPESGSSRRLARVSGPMGGGGDSPSFPRRRPGHTWETEGGTGASGISRTGPAWCRHHGDPDRGHAAGTAPVSPARWLLRGHVSSCCRTPQRARRHRASHRPGAEALRGPWRRSSHRDDRYPVKGHERGVSVACEAPERGMGRRPRPIRHAGRRGAGQDEGRGGLQEAAGPSDRRPVEEGRLSVGCQESEGCRSGSGSGV